MSKSKFVLEQISQKHVNIRTVRRLLNEAAAGGDKPELRSEHISSRMTRRKAKIKILGVTTGSKRVYIYYARDDKSPSKAAMVYTDGEKRFVRIHFGNRNHDVFLD